jgi:biopolymer transport protein ExbD
MRFKTFVLSLVAIAPFAYVTLAQDLDDSLYKAQRRREQQVAKLSVDEQLKLRAAEQEASEDPTVKAALEKRNKAIQEYRAALRASMIKSDATVAPILDKVRF